jgi:hypothetical protein
MTFLVGPALNKAIQKITEEDDVRCAVAFWGKGAKKPVSQSQITERSNSM